MPQQNVILITADQFRSDALPCYGNTFVATPNFDRLADEGVVFSNACSADPICVPARAAMTTGNHPHICTGNKSNSGAIRDDQVKIAEHFNAQNYETYALGKLHYLPYQKNRIVHGFKHWELCEEGRILWLGQRQGIDLGSEEYHDYLDQVGYKNMFRAHGIGNNDIRGSVSPLPAEHYVDSWVMHRSISHLETHVAERSDTPFFMWISFVKPHSPYDPPEPYHKLLDPREVPGPIGSREMLDDRNPALRHRPDRYGWNFLSAEAVQLARARYHCTVMLQDAMLGKLFAFLDANNLRENTSILFTADHGDMLGDFGIFFKSCFFNGSVSIPMIVSPGSGLPKGQTRDHLVGSEDVLPTLCDLAGVEVPSGIGGTSMVPVIRDSGESFRDVYIAQCMDEPNQLYMAFDGRYKYCYAQWQGTEELYDEQNDPHELTNLAGDPAHRQRLAELRDAVIRFCRENDDGAMLDERGDLKQSPVDEQAATRGTIATAGGWRPY